VPFTVAPISNNPPFTSAPARLTLPNVALRIERASPASFTPRASSDPLRVSGNILTKSFTDILLNIRSRPTRRRLISRSPTTVAPIRDSEPCTSADSRFALATLALIPANRHRHEVLTSGDCRSLLCSQTSKHLHLRLAEQNVTIFCL